MVNIYDKIEKLKHDNGWSDETLAIASGIELEDMKNILRGNTQPSLIKLENICNVLHITLSELFQSPDERTISIMVNSMENKIIEYCRSLDDEKRNAIYSLLK